MLLKLVSPALQVLSTLKVVAGLGQLSRDVYSAADEVLPEQHTAKNGLQ